MSALTRFMATCTCGAAGLIPSAVDADTLDVKYRVTDITPTYGAACANAVNEANLAVGYHWGSGVDMAFAYSHGATIDLGSGVATALNDSNAIVGYSGFPPLEQGWLAFGGVRRTLGFGIPRGIAANGQICGTRGDWAYTGKVRHKPTKLDLPLDNMTDTVCSGMSPNGLMTGTAGTDSGGLIGHYAFVGRVSEWSILPLRGIWDWVEGFGVNTSGTVVGTFMTLSGYKGFKFENDRYTVLDPQPGHTRATARAINDHGVVVGESSDGLREYTAFIYASGTLIALDNLLDPDTSSGWHVKFANDINERGVIVGCGTNESDGHARQTALLLTPM